MITSDNIIACVPNVRLSMGALLRHLHDQGRLRPLILETLLAQLVREQAHHDGLSVSDEELQTAADTFRRIQGWPTGPPTRTSGCRWRADRGGLRARDWKSPFWPRR